MKDNFKEKAKVMAKIDLTSRLLQTVDSIYVTLGSDVMQQIEDKLLEKNRKGYHVVSVSQNVCNPQEYIFIVEYIKPRINEVVVNELIQSVDSMYVTLGSDVKQQIEDKIFEENRYGYHVVSVIQNVCDPQNYIFIVEYIETEPEE